MNYCLSIIDTIHGLSMSVNRAISDTHSLTLLSEGPANAGACGEDPVAVIGIPVGEVLHFSFRRTDAIAASIVGAIFAAVTDIVRAGVNNFHALVIAFQSDIA